MATEEVRKVQKHLELLREEHLQLQNRYYDLQRRYDVLSAAANTNASVSNGEHTTDKALKPSFVHKLMSTVAELYDKDLYSDITIHVDGHQLRAHRFVLASRSDFWGVADLSMVDRLEFTGMPYNIGCTLLKWVYTDQLDAKLGDSYILELMRAAQRFQLDSLLHRCEMLLVGRLDISNCVKFYQFADSLDMEKLKEKCSDLLAARWDDFKWEDFMEMSAQLLYKMLQSRAKYPLHSAIRLRREDVVFLYLIEHDAELSKRLGVSDDEGVLPLTLALSMGQESVAKTLVSHGADVNAVDARGRSLLYRAIEDCDAVSCRFLIENSAQVQFVHKETKRTLLHALAANVWPTSTAGDLTAVAESVVGSEKVDINAVDANRRSALHEAILANNGAMIDLLLRCERIALNSADDMGGTALSLALDRDDLALAEKLAQRGADVNSRAVDGATLLFSAVAAGKLANVQFLLKNSADPNLANNKNETPLHEATKQGATNILSALLASQADVNKQTADGNTPLHVAISCSQSSAIQVILNRKKEELQLELVNSEGETALGAAIWKGEEEAATALIKAGANVNAKHSSGLSLLLRAIEAGSDDNAQFLIKHGADAGARTPEGLTSLQLAVSSGLCATVRDLCRAGADLNTRHKDTQLPPLWTALERGDLEVASTLVEHGCDTDAWSPGPSDCEQTLLHRAIDESNEVAAGFLIRSMCDVNAVRRPGPNGQVGSEANDKQTPLHLASSWGLEDTVAALIEMNANVNAQDVDGRTPVHVAVMEHHEPILKILLSAQDVCLTLRDKFGLSPFSAAMQSKNNKAAQAILNREPRVANQVNSKGYNLLHTAVKQKDLEAVLFLLGVQSDVNVVTQDAARLTPLHICADVGDELIMRNLLLAGAHVDALSARGYSPLLISTYNDQPQMCSILLENGADCNSVDKLGNNALHAAVHKGSVQCVRILLTESSINAEAVNQFGQTPLLVLGQNGKENATAIFDMFLETMPRYPIDHRDVNGNTMLLLAYINGNANLCKAAVRAGACLGAINDQGVSIFSYQTPTKQLLFRLLDQLENEPRWAEGDVCSECSSKFSLTMRKHHCRHCGRLLCARCSERTMPILKYDLQKAVRVCDICYDVLTLGAQH
uniref:Ankyrin repeat and FYVE domain containing 1 n=2 Tax=Plectus sambesii TaxID=2011161 RepID=A0A914XLN2_9BILA